MVVAALKTSTDLSKPDRLLGVAAECATESVPVPRRDQRVGEVREQLASPRIQLALVDADGRFLGLIPP